MADPIQMTHVAVSEDTANSYQAARKELRDARMRWIDQHEMPQQMTTVDRNGDAVKMPFFIGKITSGNGKDFDKGYVPGPEFSDPRFAKGLASRPNALPEGMTLDEVEKELDETIRKYLALEGVTVTPAAPGELAFVDETSHRAQHPPVEEGERYEEYVKRVSRAYAQSEEWPSQTRRPGVDFDGIRVSSGDDTSGRRPVHGDGGSGGKSVSADASVASEPDTNGTLPASNGANCPATGSDSSAPTVSAATASGESRNLHSVQRDGPNDAGDLSSL